MVELPRVLLHAGVRHTGAWHMQRCLKTAAARQDKTVWSLPYAKPRNGLEWLLNQQPETAPGSTLVVVDQSLAKGPPPALMRRARKRFDCHVSLFLLRQDVWLESHFVNRILRGDERVRAEDFRSFAAAGRYDRQLDYAALLDRWTAELGRENVSATWISSGFTAGALTTLFLDLHQLGPVRCEAPTSDRRLERPWPAEIAQLAALMQVSQLPYRQHRTLVSALNTLARDRGTGLATDTERAEILTRFAGSNRRVAEVYNVPGGEVLTETLDYIEVPPRPISEQPPSEYLQYWIEPLLVELAWRLVEVRRKAGQNSESMELLVEKQQSEIEQLEREIADLEATLASTSAIMRRLWLKLSSVFS